MLLREITDWTFAEELAAQHKLMIVHCVQTGIDISEVLTGRLHELAGKYSPNARFFELDFAENPSLAGQLRVHRLPTVILYEDGVESRRFAGPDHGDDIEDAVREALNSQETGDV